MRRWIGLLFLGLLLAPVLANAVINQWVVGTTVTALDGTQLTGIVSNGYTAAGSAINNIIAGGQGNGYTRCAVELAMTWGGTPTTPSAILVWFLRAIDGTNYEPTPTTTTGQYRTPNAVLPAIPGGATTRVTVDTWCPPGLFKVAAKNDGTGQTISAGSTVKVQFYALQGN